MNDQELLRDYTARGSEEAFRSLVERYIDLVYSAAIRQVCDGELARDVTQVVFLTLARKAGRLAGQVALSAWLYRTARLAALHAMRGECRRQRREEEAAAMNLSMYYLLGIYMAGMVWAQDNRGRYPRDFICTSNGLSTPIILRCPSDKARLTPQTWEQAAAGNISYPLVSPGTDPKEGKVYAWCPIHHQGITAAGRVAGSSPDTATPEERPRKATTY
jgi:RNA polymerase sigma factor (sigma-70 family)